MQVIRFRQIPVDARIWIADGFLDEDEIAALLAAAAARAASSGEQDSSGLHFELPIDDAPVVRTVSRRIEAVLGFPDALGGTLRFRRYRQGEYHPAHLDVYQIGDRTLVATAMLCLVGDALGGETRFGRTRPAPVSLSPIRGRLTVWCNCLPDGRPDPASWHEGMPVHSGEKTTLTCFAYSPEVREPAHAKGLAPEAALPNGVRLEG